MIFQNSKTPLLSIRNKIRWGCVLRAQQLRRSIILDRYIRQTSLEDYVALSARMYRRVRTYRRDRVVHKLSETHWRRPSGLRPIERERERERVALNMNWFFARCERDYDANVRQRMSYSHVLSSELWERIVAPSWIMNPGKANAIRSALSDAD